MAAAKGNYVPLEPWHGYQSGEDCSGIHEAQEPSFAPDQVLQVARDANSRWQHIQNLDEFFSNVYEYHQRHGFFCILLSDLFELFQFLFVVGFGVVLVTCVDYVILFKDRGTEKANLGDVFICGGPGSACSPSNPWIILVISFAAVCWLHRLVRLFYRFTVFLDIRNFYRTALDVEDSTLKNMTWYDVQDRLCDVQAPYRLCIQKSQLTSMDIYQRILRRENYLVAMFNKGLLPARFRLPFLGDVYFMTLGFKFNLDLLFFWGPWSPWENYWQLKAAYKRRAERQKLSEHLSRVILWFGLVNLLLAPLIFAWQILYCIFTYVEMVKREPSVLGTRRWSMYGRYFFRHFNELDHELDNRLNCAYKPASFYMQMFFSSTAEIVSKNVTFVASAIFSVFFILSIYDEDVLQVHNVLQVLTISGCVVAACRTFIQDENAVFCPEVMMKTILAYVHYLPDSWQGQAHSDWVRHEFSRFYEYRLTFILEELLGAIACPLALLFWLRPRAGLFIEFFRNFTVEVAGLGDVCSLAQMDVRNHGDPTYHRPSTAKEATQTDGGQPSGGAAAASRALHGKVEMSLLHFLSTNPRWEPPADALDFLQSFRAQAEKEAETFGVELEHSLYDHLGTVPPGKRHAWRGAGVSKSVVPLDCSPSVSGLTASSVFASAYNSRAPLSRSAFCAAPSVLSTAQAPLLSLLSPVNVDILYLHELHQRRRRVTGYGSMRPASTESHTV